MPVQPLADLDHGPGQVLGLVFIQGQGGGGGEEGRQLHIGVASLHHIAHDRRVGVGLQTVAVHPAADEGDGLGHRRVADLDDVAFADVQRLPGRLRQGDLVDLELVTIDLVEHGRDFPFASDQQHLRTRCQAFGVADVAVGAHDRHRLVQGMQAHADGAQMGLFGNVGRIQSE